METANNNEEISVKGTKGPTSHDSDDSGKASMAYHTSYHPLGNEKPNPDSGTLMVRSPEPHTPRRDRPRSVHISNSIVVMPIATTIGWNPEKRNPVMYRTVPSSMYQNILGTYLSVNPSCENDPMADPEDTSG